MTSSEKKKIVVVAGFQHETNTFAPQPATWDVFVEPDSWPGLTTGAPLVAQLADQSAHAVPTPASVTARGKPFPLAANIPLAGFLSAVNEQSQRREEAIASQQQRSPVAVLPLVWASATPCGTVTSEAFENMCSLICDPLKELFDPKNVSDANNNKPDAVYLDLHGAMVTEQFDDGEGELLRRVRAIVGSKVPVVVSLDLHANVSAAMVSRAHVMLAYRTYPHVDMADTGRRAFAAVQQLLARPNHRPAAALRKPPFLIPITSMVSDLAPNKAIYDMLDTVERHAAAGASSAVVSASFTPGFGLADCTDCGPALFVYADTQPAADQAADRLCAAVCAAEPQFLGNLMTPDDAVRQAVAETTSSAATKSGPIVLADAQDNPGCGATCDTVGLLQAMISFAESYSGGAAGDTSLAKLALGLICDQPSAKKAHNGGVGSTVSLELGAGTGWADEKPVQGSWRVIALSDGEVAATGPFYGGSTLSLGPCALLERCLTAETADTKDDGTQLIRVRVAVCSKKCQAADREMFEHLGLVVKDENVVGVKSAVHFRAHFGPIANQIWVVAAPGAAPCDHGPLTYHRLRAGVRTMPNKTVSPCSNHM